MTWLKGLTRETDFDKILRDKESNIAKNSKYDGYLKGLASVVYKFFDKKTSYGAIKNENMSNKDLAEELNKPFIRKFQNRNVHSSFVDNIWGADLADMQLRNKLNKGIHFSSSVIDSFSKYAWVIPWKDKKSIVITNTFEKKKESNRRPNKIKIWVDKGSKFYNRTMNSFL